LERSNVLKIDLDVKVSQKLLEKWLETRKLILEHLGYTITKIRYVETEKGYHFWIHLKENLEPKEVAELQFLLGDDHNRARYNFLRLKFRTFHEFNVLFNRKKRIERPQY